MGLGGAAIGGMWAYAILVILGFLLAVVVIGFVLRVVTKRWRSTLVLWSVTVVLAAGLVLADYFDADNRERRATEGLRDEIAVAAGIELREVSFDGWRYCDGSGRGWKSFGRADDIDVAAATARLEAALERAGLTITASGVTETDTGTVRWLLAGDGRRGVSVEYDRRNSLTLAVEDSCVELEPPRSEA